jgi:hypothetical protein
VKAAGVPENPDDCPCVVDAQCFGGGGPGKGNIDRGESAAAQEEAMLVVTRIEKRAGDQPRVVDAMCLGDAGGQGIIDRAEDIDGHVCRLLIAGARLPSGHRVATARPQSYVRPRKLAKDAASVKKAYRRRAEL